MYNLASVLGGLGMGQGMNQNPGSLMSVLGQSNVGDPSMTQASTGMAAPGTMPMGMGNAGMPAFPGGPQMGGGGLQMPGAQGQGGTTTEGQSTLASVMARMQDPAVQQAMMQMAMQQQQQQQQPMSQIGALPVAGMGAQRRSPSQGYMAAGGGVAPQRVMRI